MLYVAAFIFLVGLGLGVNYLMTVLIKNRFNAKENTTPAEDGFPPEAKEEIQKEIDSLKQAVKALLEDIDEKSKLLAERQSRINELIRLVDERLAELTQLGRESEAPDWENVKSTNQNNFQRVFELHQQGLKSTDIARNLGIGVGEVELRLGILNKVRYDGD